MSDIKLKPCPACNGQAEMGYESACFYVYCTHCNTCGATEMDISPDAKEQAAEAWNALPRRLQWTTETPTENGWYIFQERRNRRLCCVIDGKVTGFAFGLCKVEDLRGRGQWAGPIPEPQEQP